MQHSMFHQNMYYQMLLLLIRFHKLQFQLLLSPFLIQKIPLHILWNNCSHMYFYNLPNNNNLINSYFHNLLYIHHYIHLQQLFVFHIGLKLNILQMYLQLQSQMTVMSKGIYHICADELDILHNDSDMVLIQIYFCSHDVLQKSLFFPNVQKKNQS